MNDITKDQYCKECLLDELGCYPNSHFPCNCYCHRVIN